MSWRLGLDLGTNSIGWWAYRLERVTTTGTRFRVVESLDGGVRIFSDGREPSSVGRVGDSRAVERRRARGMRKTRDRAQNRVRWLVGELVRLGLLPEDSGRRAIVFGNRSAPGEAAERWNPYRLRALAAEGPVAADELGRALAHLGRRRGFKSNRKDLSEDEGGALAARIEELRERLNGQTLGRFLWERFQAENAREAKGEKRNGIRFRGEDEFYPDRAMYAAEFDAIQAAQGETAALTDEDWARLRAAILGQRPLKPVERGCCEFLRGEPRHWKDTPIAEDYRIFQELNNLRWIDADEVDHVLDRAQREAVLEQLMTRRTEVKFDSLRKLKGAAKRPLFPHAVRFNLEGVKRKSLRAHRFAARFLDAPELAPLWRARAGAGDCVTTTADDGRLDDIFEVLHGPGETEEIQALLESEFGLPPEAARKLASWPLASATASVSRRFMEQIVPVMRDQGLEYWEAAAQLTDDTGAPLHHSLRDDGRRWPVLPYYGAVVSQSTAGGDAAADPDAAPEKHFGRIANPTVHVALNQLRKVVNALTERFGCAPCQIHVEVTRELKLPKGRREEMERRQAANERENNRIRAECAAIGFPQPSARDIRKWKLWEELGKDQMLRRCVFTGKPISAAQLFNGEVEIEHILPFSRTLDDGIANQTLSFRWANRLKGNDTPHEAFAAGRHADKGIAWEDLMARVRFLPREKRWRFGSGAMERFEREQDFIARQLTDTAYIARVAARYLGALAGVEDVVANPGRLTAMVRGKWGFNGILSDDNRKIRADHRHHAVDAAVIGLIDRALLQRVARDSARGADDIVRLRLPDFADIAEPAVLEAIRARVPEIVVSFKPDHGLQGKFFTDTAYGPVPEPGRDSGFPGHDLVTRKPVTSLTSGQCEAIRDSGLRNRVRDYLREAREKGRRHEDALAEFAAIAGVRSVRVLEANRSAVTIGSAPYKRYVSAGYVFCDIWFVPESQGRKPYFRGEFWTYVDVAVAPLNGSGQPEKGIRKPHPAAKFVTRLFKDDTIALEKDGRSIVAKVVKFGATAKRIFFLEHNLANDQPSQLAVGTWGQYRARKLSVSPDGRVRDPGVHAAIGGGAGP